MLLGWVKDRAFQKGNCTSIIPYLTAWEAHSCTRLSVGGPTPFLLTTGVLVCLLCLNANHTLAVTMSGFGFFKVEEGLQVVPFTFHLDQVLKWIGCIVSLVLTYFCWKYSALFCAHFVGLPVKVQAWTGLGASTADWMSVSVQLRAVVSSASTSSRTEPAAPLGALRAVCLRWKAHWVQRSCGFRVAVGKGVVVESSEVSWSILLMPRFHRWWNFETLCYSKKNFET